MNRDNLFLNNHLPSISALPTDQKFWRIDWFGEIAFPNRLMRSKQPSVLLHMSPVIAEGFHENPSLLLGPGSTFASKQRKVWVSVGTMPLLRVGDIWRNGQLDAIPDYELETFENLEIDARGAVLIKAGINLEDRGFLLPMAEHPWHMQCTQSYCLMVELSQGKRLIIPCMELIRFYFGSSSNLLTKLFLPPLTRESLYLNPQFDKNTRQLVFELADGASGFSAPDIGRLHLDQTAWRAAAHVGVSLLKASTANQPIFPQGFFPFEGKTTLIAAGKWLSHDKDPRSTFIVYSLRSCSYPFPFRSLRYGTKNRKPRSAHQNGDHVIAPFAAPRKTSRDARNQGLVEKDPSSRLNRRSKYVWNEARFPDLARKTIWKNKTITPPPETVFAGSSPDAVSNASIGDPGSERRVRSIDLAMRIKQCEEFAPEFLRPTVDELKSIQGLSIDLLTASAEDGWTIPITLLADEDGVIDLNLFLDESVECMRVRRVGVFALKRGREHVSVVIIESVPVHLKLYLTAGDDPQEIWQTLQCAAADFIRKREPKNGNIIELINWLFSDDC